MSHFTTIKTRINDFEILKKSLKELGYSFQEGNLQVKGYQGITEKVNLLVKMQGGYNIGFRKNAQGTYDVIADWWGVRGVSENTFKQQIKSIENKILQQYAYEKVKKELLKRSMPIVEETTLEDNTIQLTVRVWS